MKKKIQKFDNLRKIEQNFYMEQIENKANKSYSNWIQNLAVDEKNMEQSGVVNFNDHLNPSYHLEESSIELMEILREKFDQALNEFNAFRGTEDKSKMIKVYKISNTVNDFMLFRNSLKLVVARKSHDIISVGFLSNSGGLFSARLNNHEPSINKAHELRAHIGPFNEITWRFQGDLVDLDILVRHYLTEFIKHSAR
jgi:hypothetical protein